MCNVIMELCFISTSIVYQGVVPKLCVGNLNLYNKGVN